MPAGCFFLNITGFSDSQFPKEKKKKDASGYHVKAVETWPSSSQTPHPLVLLVSSLLPCLPCEPDRQHAFQVQGGQSDGPALWLGLFLFVRVVAEDYRHRIAGFWSVDLRERVVRDKIGSGL
ncbi:hypothetical protein MLD38_033314 [Melastoma candidum]|uniref:Uncharacterized protein n=1 Tax=Melastoma candidum TaxID=119954 RepID=A0ACB9M6D4_9MYRT|nr:hypothetical protein MLD38_033314 [Melastoma candidum]